MFEYVSHSGIKINKGDVKSYSGERQLLELRKVIDIPSLTLKCIQLLRPVIVLLESLFNLTT